MISFIQAHSVIASLVAYYIVSAFVSSLPAPTTTSSVFYVFIFKFTNTLSANLVRAYGTKVEASPNFQAAVTKAVNGGS